MNNISNKNILIVANGDPPSIELLSGKCRLADIIICADGGANVFENTDFEPDHIVGDLDSFNQDLEQKFKSAIIVRNEDQNNNDLHKALEYSMQFDPNSISILGATGERIDHTIANIFLIFEYCHKVKIEIEDDLSVLKPVINALNLQGHTGQKVSLFSISEKCEGVTLEGFKYPLKNADLAPGTLGLSNEMTGNEVSISLRSGQLLIIINK